VLMMLALPVGALAAITYFKAGFGNFRAALWIAGGFVLGAALSAHFAVKLPEHAVARIFGGVLLLVAAKLLIFGR
jgi:uncharacterized membrane protein YfcA